MDWGTQATSLEPRTEDSQTRLSSSSSAEMISACDGAIVSDDKSDLDSNLIIVVDFEFDTSHLLSKRKGMSMHA